MARRDYPRATVLRRRQQLVKIGAKVGRHAKYATFQLADVVVPRKLFRAILRRIAKLRLPETRGSPA
jgi:hypothetical protein